MKAVTRWLATLASVFPLAATAGPETADWVLAGGDEGSALSAAHAWHPHAGKILVVDPVVYTAVQTGGWIDIPNRAAQFQIMRAGPPYHEPSAALLIFANGTPVCSRNIGYLAVDAGIGAFLTPQAENGINTYLATLPDGWSLYDGLLYEQSDHDRNDLTVFKLPDGTEFPGFATGGDGGFPLLSLHDAKGAQLALLVDLTRLDPSPFSTSACG